MEQFGLSTTNWCLCSLRIFLGKFVRKDPWIRRRSVSPTLVEPLDAFCIREFKDSGSHKSSESKGQGHEIKVKDLTGSLFRGYNSSGSLKISAAGQRSTFP